MSLKSLDELKTLLTNVKFVREGNSNYFGFRLYYNYNIENTYYNKEMAENFANEVDNFIDELGKKYAEKINIQIKKEVEKL